MSFAADFESQTPVVEMLALEVVLFAPEAEFVAEVAQFLTQVVGKADLLQAVEVEQLAGIGLLHPLKVGEGISLVGLQSRLDRPLAKLTQEQLAQLVLQTIGEYLVGRVGKQLGGLVGGLVGGQVGGLVGGLVAGQVGGSLGGQLVEFQSWPVLWLTAVEHPLTAEVMAER